jgi:cell filamentation protein
LVHVEFVLVHPFREGNGRLSRLIATVMALQAGKPALDFSYLDRDKFRYVSAIQAGLSDYGPMKDLFRQVLRDSGKNVSG